MKALSTKDKFIWLCFAVIASLLIFRIFYSGSIRYVFLVWNLFLAWIPCIIAGQLALYLHKPKWKQITLFCGWLLFFPNALYIVTDLVHLKADTNIPWWFDAMFLFLNGFVGLMLAFFSLMDAEKFLRNYFNSKICVFLIPLLLFLGSYGVYLGRFERWNSWNIINQPFSLFSNIFDALLNPVENWKVWATTLLFTVIYSILYYSMQVIPAVTKEQKNTGS